MNKLVNDFIDKKKNDISFITLKKGAKLPLGKKTYVNEIELPVPVKLDNLVNDIKKQEEYDGITIKNIIDGIIYILGSDDSFKYKSEYLEILKMFDDNYEAFIIYNVNNFFEDNIEDGIVYAKCLVNLNENEKNCFVYANILEKNAVYLSDKKLNYESAGFMKEAKKYYEKCLDYNDKFTLGYYKLGYYYKSEQKYCRAKLYWDKLIEYDDDQIRIQEIRNELELLKPYIDYENGYNYVLKGEAQRGLDLLLPLVEKNSGWWNLLFFVGLAFRILKEYTIAEKYFENVIKIQPDQLDSVNELGMCRLLLSNYEGAIEMFNLALNIKPKNSEILCNRAAGYIYLNDLDKAEKDVERALKINETDEIAISIQRQIDSMRNNSK